MSQHTARIRWTRDGQDFGYESYSRDHSWSFEGGTELRASAAPDYLGNPACVDPEEAFVASIASCHMLTFLALAARKRFVVDHYEDAAQGTLAKNAEGRLAVTRVVLRPRVRFDPARLPSPEELARIHELAHQHCFIANSVATEIAVEPAPEE